MQKLNSSNLRSHLFKSYVYKCIFVAPVIIQATALGNVGCFYTHPSVKFWCTNTRTSKQSYIVKQYLSTNFAQHPHTMPTPPKVSDPKAPKVVFVLGGPGAGKGTQCGLISERMGYKHISAGDCLREERNTKGSEVGELIESFIREGKIVPVKITCELLKKKMEQHGWENGMFLIDGFPRNEDNLTGWLKNMEDVKIEFCLYMECDEEIMKSRILKRGELSGRTDDNTSSILKRFYTYRNETLPIINWFQEHGMCRKIDAALSVDEVWENIQRCFSENKTDDVQPQ